MKFGAEPKKIGFLAVLTVVAGYLLYSNLFSSPSAPQETRTARQAVTNEVRQAATVAAGGSGGASAVSGRTTGARRTAGDFHPVYKSKETPDLSAIDPKLRLDLLAKVQAVEPMAAERNLFQFGAAPVPGGKDPTVRPGPMVPGKGSLTTASGPSGPSGPPTPPPPPPITLRYYGFVSQRTDGHKRAFFLDGEDILVAGEGELMKRRYKVLHIGVSSVTLEDTQYNNTQMVPLTEEGAG